MPTNKKHNLDNWIIAARQTVELSDGTVTAATCMERAEDQAATPGEYTQVAVAWIQCLDNQQAANRCMEKAEALTRASGHDEIGDCVALASAYVHDLNDSTKAEIWRQKVVEVAGSYGTSGWLHAAITAKKIHSANRQLALQ